MIVMDYSKKRDSEKFIKNNNMSIPFSFGELFEKDELLRVIIHPFQITRQMRKEQTYCYFL